MSDKKSNSLIKRIFIFCWKLINGFRKVFLNIIFFGLLGAILFSLGDDEPKKIEESSALILNLSGQIVDQKTFVDPWQSLLTKSNDENKDSETLLSDVLKVIDTAAYDPRISALILNLSNLTKTDLSKLQTIGNALAKFKKSGKPIIASENFYNQQQYYLASFADTIYLNPKGAVMIDGLANYRLFYKSALEKLNVQTHVFRVGSFKSAVEPFIRDDMSAEAKEASLSLMNNLWQSYSLAVVNNRNMPADKLALNADDILKALDKANGDTALMAINQGWVDKLANFDTVNQAMINLVGADKTGHSYKKVNFKDYLLQILPTAVEHPSETIGIITAKGNILNGKQQAGKIGGESTSALLRNALYNQNIKAVVLRIDSPGGSAFASEQIRQEVLALKAAGKPVIVSMGGVAASGGYWIAADANYIFATPTTITGSIGIFGMFATFDKTLNDFGVYNDGVATNDWAGLSVTRPLSPAVAAVVQRHVDRGYKDFIDLVAQARHKSTEAIDKIAQGRVWTGKQALQLGLVDELGELQDAVKKAAQLAKVMNYDTQNIEQKLTTEQLLMQEIFSSAQAYLPESINQISLLEKIYAQWSAPFAEINNFNDPKGLYLYCDTCNI